jgi:hypothetical protein
MAPGGQACVIERSRLGARAEEVWDRAVSLEGINHELGPWLRMTMPSGFAGEGIDDAPLGEPLGRSWILLLGVIPVDYDDLVLAERGPGLRFLERSQLLTMRRWQHEREVVPLGETCELVDRLTFEPRFPLSAIPGMGRLGRAIVGFIFRHRHRRLAARFGVAS